MNYPCKLFKAAKGTIVHLFMILLPRANIFCNFFFEDTTQLHVTYLAYTFFQMFQLLLHHFEDNGVCLLCFDGGDGHVDAQEWINHGWVTCPFLCGPFLAPSHETARCEPDGFTALRMNCRLDRGQNSLEHELNALFPGQQPTQVRNNCGLMRQLLYWIKFWLGVFILLKSTSWCPQVNDESLLDQRLVHINLFIFIYICMYIVYVCSTAVLSNVIDLTDPWKSLHL